MATKKGFGFDFLVNVVVGNVKQVKNDLNKLFQSSELGKLHKAGVRASDISTRIEAERKKNIHDMSYWEQRQHRTRIARLEELRRRMANYNYIQGRYGDFRGNAYLAYDRVRAPLRDIQLRMQNARAATSDVVGLVKKWAVALGVVYVAYKALSLILWVVSKAVKTITSLFEESLELGKKMEQMSLRLRFVYGSETNAVNAMQMAMDKFKNWKFDDAMAGMQRLSDLGIDVTKNMDMLKNMAGSVGGSISETAEDIANAIGGSETALAKYGILSLQKYRAIASYPVMMRGAILKEIESHMDRFKGGAERYAKSWEGMLNFMSNAWTKFKFAIIGRSDDESSLFGWMKKSFGKITEFIENNWEKIQAIGQGIGLLFKAVAQQVFGLVDSWMNALADLKKEDIQEWFMRASVKVSLFTQWLINKFKSIFGKDGKEFFEKLTNGVKSTIAALETMAKAVIRMGQAVKFIYELVNPMSWGKERWKNISEDWNALTSPINLGGGGGSAEEEAKPAGARVWVSNKDLNARAKKEGWDADRYKRERERYVKMGFMSPSGNKPTEVKVSAPIKIERNAEERKDTREMVKSLHLIESFMAIDAMMQFQPAKITGMSASEYNSWRYKNNVGIK